MATRDIPPIHPGEHLKEFMEEYGLSQYRLAKDINVPVTRIGKIIHHQRGISADTALRLGRYFGTTAQFWINLQSSYDLETAQIALGPRLEKIKKLATA